MIKDKVIVSLASHHLKDPVFSQILRLVAEWANKEGLENRKCTNFSIGIPHDEDDPLNILTSVTCDIDE